MHFGDDLRQPDNMSCGASSVVVARMIRDDFYAEEIRPIYSSVVQAMHRSFHVWPRRYGTAWWSVAWHLSQIEGVHYALRPAYIGAGFAFDRLLEVARSGKLAALYVGTRTLPRHVTLVVGELAGSLRVFDPATGMVTSVTRESFTNDQLRLGGWPKPWVIIVPGFGP